MKQTKKTLDSVRSNFNTIAEDFAQTRQFIWPDVKKFVPKIRRKDKVLDLGCGNGRMAELIENKKNYLGIDFSAKLLKIAHKSYPRAHFLLGDITKPKLWSKITQKSKFNLILCIATLHHIPKEKQNFVLEHIYNSIGKNGRFVLSVWNLWQSRFWLDHFKQLGKKVFSRSLFNLWVPYQVSNCR